MNYNTLYVGMDVHKESFTVCSYDMAQDKVFFTQRMEPDYRRVLEYLRALRDTFGDDVNIVCGYEAGCLGFTLYRQLRSRGAECVILAPTTMMKAVGKKKTKTDKRDAALIAKCLAFRTYSPVHVPAPEDEQVKEYIRMRDDHRIALKRLKQQILAFCLRHGFSYTGARSYWTEKHLNWLRSLKPEGYYGEVLSEYLLSYTALAGKIKRFDARIKELADSEPYRDGVRKLSCFLGVRSHTALSVIVEAGDFRRFSSAERFASYIGLVPGEDSSGGTQKRLGITKAGNTHVRCLLVEAAQCYARGRIGYKSAELKARQSGNSPEVIAYADRANERLRRRYYKMVLNKNKRHNVAKTAVARELACFIWGMMTGNIS